MCVDLQCDCVFGLAKERQATQWVYMKTSTLSTRSVIIEPVSSTVLTTFPCWCWRHWKCRDDRHVLTLSLRDLAARWPHSHRPQIDEPRGVVGLLTFSPFLWN